jgi:hypothetical protein
MAVDTILRRLRGVLGNAMVWGIGWFTAALAVFATVRLLGGFPDTSLLEGLETAGRFGIVGGVAGAAFSSVIRLVYHGRRLSDISWVRFGLGGAAVTGLFMPVFLQTMNLLSGTGLVPWTLVLDDAVLTAVFGGVAAGGSMKIAQYAESALPDETEDRVNRFERRHRLGSAADQENRG